jgi:hypothetical protein
MSWARSNLARFLGAEIAYVALLAAIIRAPLDIGLTMFVVSAVLTLPMLPIYLVLIARLPPGWSKRRQRTAAIAASPLLLALYTITLGGWIGPTGLFLVLAALPGPLAYGALVRIRARQPPATPRIRARSA